MDPEEVEHEEQLTFLSSVLPRPPARVLDAGCGRGGLAARLIARGFSVVGVEHDSEGAAHARGRGVPVAEGDFLTYEDDAFDAVLFSRSLHHMHPLPAAVSHARELLGPEGVIVLDEMALERADARAAEWVDHMLELLDVAGVISTSHDASPLGPVERWKAEDPPLHTGEAMLAELGNVCGSIAVESAPYLYSYVCGRLVGGARGYRVAKKFLDLERALVSQGALAPVGLRVVGRRKA